MSELHFHGVAFVSWGSTGCQQVRMCVEMGTNENSLAPPRLLTQVQISFYVVVLPRGGGVNLSSVNISIYL